MVPDARDDIAGIKVGLDFEPSERACALRSEAQKGCLPLSLPDLAAASAVRMSGA
jgi:hypothetical protein